MGRSRFVRPEVTRLYLADAAKAAHAKLVASPFVSADERAKQLAASEARVSRAVEDADYIDIKRRLNTGEQRAVFARMARDIKAGEDYAFDPAQVGIAKIAAYLIGWSFVDDAGKPVDCSTQAIDNLDTDTFREIREAIEAHEEHIDAEIAASKNATDGAKSSSAISPSADA